MVIHVQNLVLQAHHQHVPTRRIPCAETGACPWSPDTNPTWKKTQRASKHRKRGTKEPRRNKGRRRTRSVMLGDYVGQHRNHRSSSPNQIMTQVSIKIPSYTLRPLVRDMVIAWPSRPEMRATGNQERSRSKQESLRAETRPHEILNRVPSELRQYPSSGIELELHHSVVPLYSAAQQGETNGLGSKMRTPHVEQNEGAARRLAALRFAVAERWPVRATLIFGLRNQSQHPGAGEHGPLDGHGTVRTASTFCMRMSGDDTVGDDCSSNMRSYVVVALKQ